MDGYIIGTVIKAVLVLAIILVIRPYGLFGTHEIERV